VAAVSPSWVAQVTAQINRHKRYPADARGALGTVTVAFRVSRDGRVLSRQVAKSSGVAALDAEALAALARAQPLPAFPASMAGASVSVTAPFVFVAR
jgi:protein TonB